MRCIVSSPTTTSHMQVDQVQLVNMPYIDGSKATKIFAPFPREQLMVPVAPGQTPGVFLAAPKEVKVVWQRVSQYNQVIDQQHASLCQSMVMPCSACLLPHSITSQQGAWCIPDAHITSIICRVQFAAQSLHRQHIHNNCFTVKGVTRDGGIFVYTQGTHCTLTAELRATGSGHCWPVWLFNQHRHQQHNMIMTSLCTYVCRLRYGASRTDKVTQRGCAGTQTHSAGNQWKAGGHQVGASLSCSRASWGEVML